MELLSKLASAQQLEQAHPSQGMQGRAFPAGLGGESPGLPLISCSSGEHELNAPVLLRLTVQWGHKG